jgi:poly(hydroxyalkanoate) depolymerase family esterase
VRANLSQKLLGAALLSWFLIGPARAATLQPVASWGATGVPSYISMFIYVPDRPAANPPILVVGHFCGGSASAVFGQAQGGGLVAAADRYGFIMVFPQTTNPATSAKCWDVGSKASLTHDGGGDTQAIAQMVKYEIDKRHADASRVYVMGASSGAMLTEAMLAVYPDVFKAGAEFSGVPAGCWSVGWSAASNWGGTCASGQASKTPQQWGDLVRGMYPGYAGFRPRVQLWHGTADTTIDYNNQTEAIKEWTNVLGLPMSPTSTDSTSVSGFKIEKWQNACPFTVLEAHTQSNGGHSTPIDANAVISFFGLDKPGADPQVAACGNSGSAGATAGGSGGAMAAGGGGAMAGSGAMAGGRGGAMAAGGGGGGATAAASGAMTGGNGGRANTGMLGTAGMLFHGSAGQVAISDAAGAGVAGTSANPGTGAPPIRSAGSSATSGAGSGGCAVARGRDTPNAMGALILAACAATLVRRRRRQR